MKISLSLKVATKLNELAIGCEHRRGLVHANQQPMAPNSGNNVLVKHRHELVTDCHRLPMVPMLPIVLTSAPMVSVADVSVKLYIYIYIYIYIHVPYIKFYVHIKHLHELIYISSLCWLNTQLPGKLQVPLRHLFNCVYFISINNTKNKHEIMILQ